MQRTKFSHSKGSELPSLDKEPFTIPMAAIHMLLRQEHSADLIALYTFYYYTARWQKTDQIKASNSFVKNALRWGNTKLTKTKKSLLDLQMIIPIVKKDFTNNVNGHYVKINLKGPFYHQNSQKPQCGKWEYKCFKNNNINAYPGVDPSESTHGDTEFNFIYNNNSGDLPSIKRPSKQKRAMEYKPEARRLSAIIRKLKNIKHPYWQINSWALNICQLVEDNGITLERINSALSWYEKHAGDPYVPLIESGDSFKRKFAQLESAMTRISYTSKRDIKPTKIMEEGEWYYLDTQRDCYYNKEGRKLVV